jgi:hypothetical protein
MEKTIEGDKPRVQVLERFRTVVFDPGVNTRTGDPPSPKAVFRHREMALKGPYFNMGGVW